MKSILIAMLIIFPILFSACSKGDPVSDSSSSPQEYQYLLETVESDEHTHEVASLPQTVSNPISGYCGNMITKIASGDDEYSFWGGDSVTLTDIVINLDYSKPMCKCAAEFFVYVESNEKPHEVNLTEAFIRFEDKHASLTEEQVETIREIYDRQFSESTAKDLCGYPKAEWFNEQNSN